MAENTGAGIVMGALLFAGVAFLTRLLIRSLRNDRFMEGIRMRALRILDARRRAG